MVTEEEVRHIAVSLPEANDGGVGFDVRGKGFAWFFSEKVAGQKGRVLRMDVLAVRVADVWEKEALIALDGDKFFSTPHYNGYPAILVNLPRIEVEELQELLTAGWRVMAPKRLVKAFDSAQTLQGNDKHESE